MIQKNMTNILIMTKVVKKLNKTKIRNTDKQITVDLEQLSAMLGCGKATARKVGEQAEARIVIGRRVLYSVEKIQRYLNCCAE